MVGAQQSVWFPLVMARRSAVVAATATPTRRPTGKATEEPAVCEFWWNLYNGCDFDTQVGARLHLAPAGVLRPLLVGGRA